MITSTRLGGARRLLLACGVAVTVALAAPAHPAAHPTLTHAYADGPSPTDTPPSADTPPSDLVLPPTAGMDQQWTAPPDAAGTDPANPDSAVLDTWSTAVAPAVENLNATAQAASAGDPQALAAVVSPPPTGQDAPNGAALAVAASALPSCRNYRANGNVGYIETQSR